ncbi:hypothetical protein HMPREF9318_01444 [Streptococcus urinalis FB127-CNA-2]|uniref:TIGR02206 family protein n=1 Tax=Streptococcus urinalis 2285-97 TaxID=764291 RepID=G5KDH9_9STRE|nr:TIGR02206 family membrane protein [Streptococcus urinalis]EHJ56488.1 TIGR02206 family protein [Streptococcus urinalis 2285-97]EKS19368.1 hypothetical protein HMPREF9318_01444 [Streptococcus urinalis FB127-CNA-2]VEF31498.1 major facilitator superfamily permease [Streptococcus urinalis]
MTHFLTTSQVPIPVISPIFYSLMIITLIVLTFLSLKHYKKQRYHVFFKKLQIIQMLTLYLWYLGAHISLSESLPFYHCRIAMFVLLFMPDRRRLKLYFAFLGLIGATCAICHPILDPYKLPHITTVSYLVGHYALYVNALVYLLTYYQANQLNFEFVLKTTLVMNIGLIFVNLLTGGNYGFLKTSPIVNSQKIGFNYMIVSLVLICSIVLCNNFFKRNYSIYLKMTNED